MRNARRCHDSKFSPGDCVASHTKTTWKGRDDAKRFMRTAHKRTRKKNVNEEAELQRIHTLVHIHRKSYPS